MSIHLKLLKTGMFNRNFSHLFHSFTSKINKVWKVLCCVRLLCWIKAEKQNCFSLETDWRLFTPSKSLALFWSRNEVITKGKSVHTERQYCFANYYHHNILCVVWKDCLDRRSALNCDWKDTCLGKERSEHKLWKWHCVQNTTGSR